jgi:hypothetical protein
MWGWETASTASAVVPARQVRAPSTVAVPSPSASPSVATEHRGSPVASEVGEGPRGEHDGEHAVAEVVEEGDEVGDGVAGHQRRRVAASQGDGGGQPLGAVGDPRPHAGGEPPARIVVEDVDRSEVEPGPRRDRRHLSR